MKTKEEILKEFEEKSMSDFYKKENNNYNDEYRKAFNISKSFKVVKYPREVDFKIIRNFISNIIDQTREETIREIKEKLNKVIKYNSEISEDYQYAYIDLVEEINKLKI